MLLFSFLQCVYVFLSLVYLFLLCVCDYISILLTRKVRFNFLNYSQIVIIQSSHHRERFLYSYFTELVTSGNRLNIPFLFCTNLDNQFTRMFLFVYCIDLGLHISNVSLIICNWQCIGIHLYVILTYGSI